MMLRQLPFARGHATVICPVYPAIRPGARRYRPHVAVCMGHLFIASRDSEGGSAASLDERIAQATFFDRAALLPWAVEHLGPLELHRLTAASPTATWQQQSETLDTLQSIGVISDDQALRLARDLKRRLLQPSLPTDHGAVRRRRRTCVQPSLSTPSNTSHPAPPMQAVRPRASSDSKPPQPRRGKTQMFSIFGQIEAAAAEFMINEGELIRIPAERIPPSAAFNDRGQCALFAVIVPASKLVRFERLIADLRA